MHGFISDYGPVLLVIFFGALYGVGKLLHVSAGCKVFYWAVSIGLEIGVIAMDFPCGLSWVECPFGGDFGVFVYLANVFVLGPLLAFGLFRFFCPRRSDV